MVQWSDDDLDDDEYPDEEFDDDETETELCPACGAEIYEDAEQCPICGSYITASTSPFQGRSLVWVVLGLLGVAAVVGALLAGGS